MFAAIEHYKTVCSLPDGGAVEDDLLTSYGLREHTVRTMEYV